jgi:Uma2 family endonuclease
MSLIDERGSALREFQKLPDVHPPLEFFGGRAIQKMSPKLRHSIIQGELFLELTTHARPGGLGRAFVELRCTLKGNSFVFDLAYFVRDRMPDPGQLEEMADVTVAPDLAVEILSPGQTVGELKKKLRAALRRGLRLGWLIDPIHKQLIVLRPDRKPEVLKSGDRLAGGEVLPGFEIAVDVIFGWLDGNDPAPSA